MMIRKATNKDVIPISNLIQKVTDKNPNNYTQKQIDAWKKYNTPLEIQKQLRDRVIFCAFIENKLIGTIALKENYVVGFYVKYSSRKTGIGTKLLNHIEQYALSNNVNSLNLISTPSAFEFYKKRGYQLIEKVITSFYGIEYPEAKMKKNIKHLKSFL